MHDNLQGVLLFMDGVTHDARMMQYGNPSANAQAIGGITSINVLYRFIIREERRLKKEEGLNSDGCTCESWGRG